MGPCSLKVACFEGYFALTQSCLCHMNLFFKMLPALVMSVIRVSTGAFRLSTFLYVDPLTYQTTFNFVYIIQNLGQFEIFSNMLYFLALNVFPG